MSQDAPSDRQLQVGFADVVVSTVQQDVSLGPQTLTGILLPFRLDSWWLRNLTHLLGDIGGRGRVDDGLESTRVRSLLVVQLVLHHHGDGRDLISELPVVLTGREKPLTC